MRFKGVFIARTCFPDDCRGPPRGFGDTGRRAIHFQGFGEKGHLFSGICGESITFWVLGSREQGVEEKHFRKLGRKVIFLSGSREQRPPPGGGAHYLQFFVTRTHNALDSLRSSVLTKEALMIFGKTKFTRELVSMSQTDRILA